MKAVEWAVNLFNFWIRSPHREHILSGSQICAAGTVKDGTPTRPATPQNQTAWNEAVGQIVRQNSFTTDQGSTISAPEEQQAGPIEEPQESQSPDVEFRNSKADSHRSATSADENRPHIECFVFNEEASEDYTQSFPPTMIAVSDGVMECPAILLSAELSAKIQTAVRGERERNIAQTQRNDRRKYLRDMVQSIEAKKDDLAERYHQLSQDIEQLPLQKCFIEMRAIDIRQAELSQAVQDVMIQDKIENDQMQKLNLEHIRRNFEVNQILSKVFTDAKLVEAEMAHEDFDKTLPFDTRVLDDDFKHTKDEEQLLPLDTHIPGSHPEAGEEINDDVVDEIADGATAMHELDDDTSQLTDEEVDPVQSAWKAVRNYQSTLLCAKANLQHHTHERWEAEAKWEDACEAGNETRSGFEGWFDMRLNELEYKLEMAERDLRIAIDIGRGFGLALDDNGYVPQRYELDDESDDIPITPVSTKEFVAAWIETAESGLEDSAPDEAPVEWSAKSVEMCDSQSVFNEVFEEQRERIDKWQATCGQLRLVRESETEP